MTKTDSVGAQNSQGGQVGQVVELAIFPFSGIALCERKPQRRSASRGTFVAKTHFWRHKSLSLALRRAPAPDDAAMIGLALAGIGVRFCRVVAVLVRRTTNERLSIVDSPLQGIPRSSRMNEVGFVGNVPMYIRCARRRESDGNRARMPKSFGRNITRCVRG
jgi:hypothetical protein